MISLVVTTSAIFAAVSGEIDLEGNVGLAGMHPSEGACLAIPIADLADGTAVTLVEPQTRRILDARVTGKLDGSCVTGGEVPGLLGTHGDSTYRLEIVEGDTRSYDVFVATLIPHARHVVRDGYVRADLDGDGTEESFRICLSAEGLHLTVWSGSPLEGERRWHRYHYLGFELDPSARDCTKADYESGAAVPSRRELHAYEPQMEIVRESDRSFGHDSALLDRPGAERVAEYFYSEFGRDESPRIYPIPGRDGVYLVSAGSDPRGLEDFGWRFFLLLDEGDAFKNAYRGRGMGDSYSLRPTFYTDDDKVLILAETGTEYSWGLQAYELAGDTMSYLGPISAAYWSGESNVNPLAQSKVTSGKEGYRVQFYSDLTLNPGGLDEWTLPRLKESISFVQDRDRFVLEDDSVGNQTCFFLIDETDSDVRSDFVHYIREIVPWLQSNRIAYSFQTHLPLKMITAGHDEISVSGEALRMNLGVIMMTPDGRMKTIYGVNTGVDLISEMTEFFGLGQRTE